MVFEDGDMTAKTFVIGLTDDADPELAEQFTVVLSNPPGGSALIDPESVSLGSHSRPYICADQIVCYTSQLVYYLPRQKELNDVYP